jgi:hypothetical protein
MAGKAIVFPWGRGMFWMLTVGFTLFTAILSGSYPAFYLSSFKPVSVLKGAFVAGRFSALPRRVLVVLQFTVSIALIIGTLVVFQQIKFAKERPTGYNRSGLIDVSMNTPALHEHFEAIRHELLQTGAVAEVARASQSPAEFRNNVSIDWSGRDPENVIFFYNVSVTPEFGKTVGWKIIEGREFLRGSPADSSGVIVNEKAVAVMGMKSPVGENIVLQGTTFKIIGVVNDMVTRSPYEPIEPAIFFLRGWFQVITIRLDAAMSVQDALAKVEPVFKKYDPSAPFDYSFVDQSYGAKFSAEERVGKLASIFSGLAIFISCLGLFGLSSFVAERRTKEIGIRKVLGASIINLWQLLSKEFVVLVVISWGVAIPLAFYYMNDWLQQFQYRVTLSWAVFVFAAFGAMVLTLVTVSYQAIKASLARPVESLRSE